MRSLVGTLVQRATAVQPRNEAPVPLASKWVDRRHPAMQPGMTSELAAYGAVSTLFGVVSRTANATAQVNWRLWRKASTGRDEDREEVTRHAALDLWTKPNPFMPRQEFVETCQQHVDLTGEGFWVAQLARGGGITGGVPLEMWPVRPDRMAPVKSPRDFLTGWVYRSPDGDEVPLRREQVVQLRMPNPLDPYRGLGPVRPLGVDLENASLSAQWNANFFRNSAEPGGIIEVDKRLSDPEFEEMVERWNEQHRGVANAHRVAILEQGKWVDRRYTQRDMQFVEARGLSREMILEAYGFPKFMLGQVDDVNRANAEASALMFANWLAVPRLERIKAALNNDVLPKYGTTAQGLEFDYDSPVPADREADNAELTARANAAKALVDAGYDPADAAAVVGLPAMKWSGRPAPAIAAPGGAP